jgi:hypothetical protein
MALAAGIRVLIPVLFATMESLPSQANTLTPPSKLSIELPRFDARIAAAGADEARQARINSGLGVTADAGWFDLRVDYDLNSKMREHSTVSTEALSQHVRSSLRSAALNRWLDLDFKVDAEGLFRAGRDTYRTRLVPNLAIPLDGFARLTVNYAYAMEKPGADRSEQTRQGYSLALAGSLEGGSIAWTGRYTATDVTWSGSRLARSSEQLDLRSTYRLDSILNLEVSAVLKQELLFSGQLAQVHLQERYGAALAWTPLPGYSLALKITTLDDSRREAWQTLGSGEISWSPLPALDLSLAFGQTLVEGGAGWLLRTHYEIGD